MAGKPDTRQFFFNCTMDEVAAYGIEAVRTKKMAARTGYAESLLYLYFKNKDDMLTQTFFEMERRVAALCENYLNDPANDSKSLDECRQELCGIIFNYFVRNYNEALFLTRFRCSEYFTDEVRKQVLSPEGAFGALYDLVETRFGIPMEEYEGPVMKYVFENTVYTASMIHEEGIVPTPELEKALLCSMLNTVAAIADAVKAQG